MMDALRVPDVSRRTDMRRTAQVTTIGSHAVTYKKHLAFKNHVYMIGFGSVGSGVLPLIMRHIDLKTEQITIITADDRGVKQAASSNVEYINHPLTPENYQDVLGERLKAGDFVVNVSVDVSSVALIDLCQEKGACYIDTCIEPWLGGYVDKTVSVSHRSNYGLRENALAVRAKNPQGATAVLTHGANPGLVSHFVKQALLNMAKETGLDVAPPKSREEWALLAEKLEIKAIHIAERDTQTPAHPKQPGEFVNTWSIDGFHGEGCQPTELGWGTHEKQLPADGHRHDFGCDSSIYLNRPGYTTRVRSWTPLEGPYQGFLITHGESISISDYLTVRDGDAVRYRPTCHYAYHPCDAAVLSVHEMSGKNGQLQAKKRLIVDEIVSGTDELGVLLMGNKKGVYWYGSRLSIDEARRLAPYNNATSLQVASTVLGGFVWAVENPNRSVVDPDDMDHERIMEIAIPYLGEVVGVWGDWNPLQGRGELFPEDIDTSDPWQFKNIRVV